MKKLSIIFVALALLFGCKSTEMKKAELDNELLNCPKKYSPDGGDNRVKLKLNGSYKYLDAEGIREYGGYSKIDQSTLDHLNYDRIRIEHELDKLKNEFITERLKTFAKPHHYREEYKQYCYKKSELDNIIEFRPYVEQEVENLAKRKEAKKKADIEAKIAAKKKAAQQKAQQERIKRETELAKKEKRKREYKIGYDHVMSKIEVIDTLSDRQIREIYSMAKNVNTMAFEGDSLINSDVLQKAYDGVLAREQEKLREFQAQFRGKVILTCESHGRTVPVYYCFMGKYSTHGFLKIKHSFSGQFNNDVFRHYDLSRRGLTPAQCDSNANKFCVMIGSDFYLEAKKGNQDATVLKAKIYNKSGDLVDVRSAAQKFGSIVITE